MNYAEEPRYSINTLRALYYGATYGSAPRGTVRLLIEGADFPTVASIFAVDTDGLTVRTPDGTVESDIRLTRILHAEVV